MKSIHIEKKSILGLSTVMVAGVIFTGCCSKERPMNILFIMSDDHTTQAIGAYGSRLSQLNPTPVIDSFAKDAVVFENCYCSNSISTPSRATTVTGQYSHTNGVLTLDERLDVSQQYLPREMRALGYQTAIVGKWHLGCEPTEFDYYKVFTQHGEQGSYFDPLFASSEDTSKPFPDNISQIEGYSSDIVTDISIEWLSEKRDASKPFFLMHHYKAPHDDFEFAPRYTSYLADVDIPVPSTLLNRDGFGSEGTRGVNNSEEDLIGTSVSSRNTYRNYVDMYNFEGDDPQYNTIRAYNEYLKRYLRCVKGVDDNLARLFKYLKDNDLWDNTIIIYSGDQGMMLGEHDLQDKRWAYEESMRMPFIMRVPGSESNGTHNDLLLSNVDFAPTLISLAGAAETPEYMQGDDFSSVFIDGENPEHWRDGVYYRYWMHMIHHNVPAHFGIRTNKYKLIFFYGRHYDSSRYGEPTMWWIRDKSARIEPTTPSFELYDIVNDPNETTNLAGDPQYADVLDQLKAEMLKLKAEVGDDDSQNTEINQIISDNF